jgi:hypothetical protein
MNDTRIGVRETASIVLVLFALGTAIGADSFPTPYSPPCTERENVFAFTRKPAVRLIAKDKYEITFAVKGNCDVTVGIVDGKGKVVRHLASGVLGPNAPAPFRKSSLEQTVHWNGKDDLGFYHKDPEKLKVKVSLGLKPEFDRLLGPTSPKALPGYVWGIAADKDGVYVFNMGVQRGHVNCRRFDHDAKYVGTLWPPSANLPPEKLGGMGYVEYAPGKRAVQAPIIDWGFWREGRWLPPGFGGDLGVAQCRPAAFRGRIYLMSSGFDHREFKGRKHFYQPKLYYINTDGSLGYAGIRGRLWIHGQRPSSCPHIAVSPDGKWLYFVRFQGERDAPPSHVLLRGPVEVPVKEGKYLAFPEGPDKAVPIVGRGMGRHDQMPGSDAKHLNFPKDVDCDSAGRVYVTDSLNNRVQVFDADGAVLETVKVDRPELIQVHRKTGHVEGAGEIGAAHHEASPLSRPLEGEALGRHLRGGHDARLVVAKAQALDKRPPRGSSRLREHARGRRGTASRVRGGRRPAPGDRRFREGGERGRGRQLPQVARGDGQQGVLRSRSREGVLPRYGIRPDDGKACGTRVHGTAFPGRYRVRQPRLHAHPPRRRGRPQVDRPRRPGPPPGIRRQETVRRGPVRLR